MPRSEFLRDESPLALAQRLGLSAERLAARMRLLDFDAASQADLAALREGLDPCLKPSIDRLYLHLQRFETTASHLLSRDFVTRLKAAQHKAFHDLLFGPHDLEWAGRRLHIGLTHHRIRLRPEWYLGAYCHYVCDLLPDLLARAADPARALAALLRVAFLDCSLTLDAYGMGSTLDTTGPGASAEGGGSATGASRHPRRATLSAPTHVRTLTMGELSVRLSFLGIDPEDDTLKRAGPALLTGLDDFLEDFYVTLRSSPDMAHLLPNQEVVDRLHKVQAAYWHELFEAPLNRLYAVSRHRIGMVHESLGLSLPDYMLSMCRFLVHFCEEALRLDEPLPLLRAVVQRVFLDIDLVLGAYLERRRGSLEKINEFASLVLGRLESGLVVTNKDLRIVSANKAFLELTDHRDDLVIGIPLVQAVSVPGLEDLARRALADESQVFETFLEQGRGRRIRAKVFGVTPDSGVHGVAIVFDDVTELLQLGDRLFDRSERYRSLLENLNGAAWELDARTHAVTSMSEGIERLTGTPVGAWMLRPGGWEEHVHPDDLPALRGALGRLARGGRVVHLEHRLLDREGDYRWVASTMNRYEDAPDRVLIRGVTVDWSVARDALAASESKDDLLAIMGHEIRTPLSAVLGLGGLLKEASVGTPQEEYAELMVSATESLLDMLEHILDHDKLRAGQLQLAQAPFELSALVEGSVRALGISAQEKGLRFSLSVDPRAPSAYIGDVRRVRQILVNLVSNAIKYTPAGAVHVQVSWEAEGPSLRFLVEDTGVGIPEAHQAGIFAPYERGQFGVGGAVGGSGLGLSICAKLVTLMRGEIRFESEEGRGTRFFVTLPMAAAPASGGPERAPSEGRPPALRILLVDDEQVIRRVGQLMLETEGHEVVTAEGGAAALAALEGQRFDLVLLDLQMREMSGWELAAQIRARLGADTPCLVALTAYRSEATRQRCREAGIAGFLTKPIRRRDLVRELTRLKETDEHG
ncbi:MAG: response regulator [Alphaproteobacteria bacterium]|nr:response regulator [Alphaproteobacteria bacterium]MCB9793828.1 response regulator [Alphaproteobacteria bacterium]